MKWTLDDIEIFPVGEQDPAFTFSINELTDPSKIRGTRSTTTKVVNTKSLRLVIGSDRMLSARRSDRPVLRRIDGGIEQFSAETVAISHDEDAAELLALGGNSAWIEWARKTKLNTFDFGLSAPVTRSLQEDSWTDENALVHFPLVNFGSFTDRLGTYNVAVDKLRPAFRIHRVLEEVFASQGYRVAARGRLAREWNKYGLMQPTDKVRSRCPLSSPLVSSPWVDASGFPAYPVNSSPVTSSPAVIRWGGGTISGPGYFDTSVVNQRYQPDYDTLIDVTVESLEVFTWATAMEGARVGFALFDKANGTVFGILWSDPLVSLPGFPGTPASPIVVTGSFDRTLISSARELTIGVFNDQGLSGASALVQIKAGSSFSGVTFRPYAIPYTEGEPLVIQTAMPSMSVLDLVTGLIKDRFLVVDTEPTTRTVNFFFFDDYFQRPSTVAKTRDWRGRIDTTRPPAKRIDDAPSAIRYRMEEDKDDTSLISAGSFVDEPGLGNADEDTGGYGPELEVKVPWAPTAIGFVFGSMRVPVMLDKGADYQEDSYDRTVRFLVFDGVRTDGGWTHDGLPVSAYPVAHFGWPDEGSVPVGFGNTVVYGDEKGGGTFAAYGRKSAALRQSRILDVNVIIYPHEMIRFNHGVPTLFDDGSGPAWYYVQEVRNFRFRGRGLSASCLLVEIPGANVSAEATSTPTANVTFPEPIVETPFPPYDPCTYAAKWPNGPVLVQFALAANSQAMVDADPVNFPLGTKIFITGQGSPASNDWEQWTGSIVTRVAPGAGTGGTQWIRTTLANGSVVDNADYSSATGWDRYLVAYDEPLFPSGMAGAYYFYKPLLDTPTTWGFYGLENVQGETVAGVYPEDSCRRVVMQFNTTTNPATGWVDSADPGPPTGELAFATPITVPPGALYYRAKYLRGAHLQGYSDRQPV